LAQKLSDSLKQPFVVENKAGATGTIGAAAVATSQPMSIRAVRAIHPRRD
jgi:tripartite-type tricarboxylate transporter receptor subunit TctC